MGPATLVLMVLLVAALAWAVTGHQDWPWMLVATIIIVMLMTGGVVQ